MTHFLTKLCVLTSSIILLSACGENTTSQNSPETASAPTTAASATPSNAEVVVIGIEGTDPPLNFRDENGFPTGFEVELIDAIAQNQGFQARVVPNAKTDLFKELENDSINVVMGGYGSTAERLEKYALSDAYIDAPNAVVVLADSNIRSIEDLHNKKLTIPKTNKAAQAEIEQYKANPSKIIEGASNYQILTNVLNKTADAAWGDKLVLSYSMENIGRDKFRFINVPYDSSVDNGVVFIMKKDNTELKTKINTGLAEVKKNGTYDKIYVKWFGNTK